VSLLEANADAAAIGQIFLRTRAHDDVLTRPGCPRTVIRATAPTSLSSRTTGVIYTGSSSKQEEHGGFAQRRHQRDVAGRETRACRRARSPPFVETTQVAPTILQALGHNPGSLTAVQKEGTQVLAAAELLKAGVSNQFERRAGSPLGGPAENLIPLFSICAAHWSAVPDPFMRRYTHHIPIVFPGMP